MSRLPTPGSDAGRWGGMLNTFLMKEHNGDGTHDMARLLRIPLTPGHVLTSDPLGVGVKWKKLEAGDVGAVTAADLGGYLPISGGTLSNNLAIYTTGSSDSSSSGGALNIDMTNNTGAGVVVYSNNDASATGHLLSLRADNSSFTKHALYIDYRGSSHAITINDNGVGSSAAFNINSTNQQSSTVQVRGQEQAKGTLKVTHENPSKISGTYDANAAGVSVNLTENPEVTGVGTAAQGVYVDSTTGTTGNLLRLRNFNIDRFVVNAGGSVAMGVNGTNTTLTKYGNAVGDEFFVGTNGAFRVQRSVGGSESLRVQIAGDSQGRVLVNSSGVVSWGNGSSAQDVNLYRGGANELKTDDSLTVAGDVSVNSASSGLVLRSPDNKRWRLQVDNNGNLSTTLIA